MGRWQKGTQPSYAPRVTHETIAHGTSKFGELVLRWRCRGGDATPSEVCELISNGVFLMDSEDASTERRLASESLARVPHPEIVAIGGLGLGFTLMEVVSSASSQTNSAA